MASIIDTRIRLGREALAGPLGEVERTELIASIRELERIPPEGFELVSYPRASASARKARPVTDWARELRALKAAGAGDGWIAPKGLPFTGSEPKALAQRGALLIATRGSAKRYRLTGSGLAAARRIAA